MRNEDAARGEMETNYFGTLEVARRFAPVLAANGGGALVNMRTPTTSGIVKLFENTCGSVDVSGLCGGTYWLTVSFKPLRRL